MYVDSDVLYSIVKETDWLRDYADNVLASRESLYTSPLALVEVEIVAKRDFGEPLSASVWEIISLKHPCLKLVALSPQAYLESQHIRKDYTMGISDSIHAAVALSHDRRIASSDQSFDKVAGLTRIR